MAKQKKKSKHIVLKQDDIQKAKDLVNRKPGLTIEEFIKLFNSKYKNR